MKFEVLTVDGKKSLDRKIARLLGYVNNHVEHISSDNECYDSSLKWAQKTIEDGIVNIAKNCFANRVL